MFVFTYTKVGIFTYTQSSIYTFKNYFVLKSKQTHDVQYFKFSTNKKYSL